MAGLIVCDVQIPQALGEGLNRWDGKAISWRDMGIRYPRASFGQAMDYTIQHIQANCGLRFEKRTDKAANLQSYFKNLGGPGGVLARQWLPGTPSPLTAMQPGEWDSAEDPDQGTLNLVTLHEIGHGIGIPHYTGGPSVMNPTLNMSMLGQVDNWFRDEMQLRYDAPESSPLPPKPVPPSLDWVKLLVMLLEWWLARKGQTVTAAERAELESKAKELIS